MDSKETEKFNKILINGYEELLKVKPENPQAHFIHYLISLLPENLQKSDEELYEFYQQYKNTLEGNSQQKEEEVEGK